MTGGVDGEGIIHEEEARPSEHRSHPGVHFDQDVGPPIASPLGAHPPNIQTTSQHDTNEPANMPVQTSTDIQQNRKVQSALGNDASAG